jgi:hypothetical protein
MSTEQQDLREAVVGLADLVREVRQHGRTARFDMRAPGLLEEARLALKRSSDGDLPVLAMGKTGA